MKTTDSKVVGRYQARPPTVRSISTITDKKMRQSLRIREIREALMEAGYALLDQQASVLGLSRSSTWAVLRGNHKSSGIQPKLIARMLTAPNLPPTVRMIIVKYINEKSQGIYGHSAPQCVRFTVQINRLSVGPKSMTRGDLETNTVYRQRISVLV